MRTPAAGWLSLDPVPRRWRWPLVGAAALAAGLAVLVLRASNAAAYLSDAAEGCVNCHVMANAYGTWRHGSHGQVAVCNDCHVPHANPAAKYAFKARDGLRHSTIFTLRREPQVLRLSAPAVPAVQSNCVRCHVDQWLMIRLAASSERPCWSCHDNFHGRVRGLSATPLVLRPELPPAGLPADWPSRGGQRP